MDEVAYITATRFARLKMVTISTDKIKFKHAIKPGTIAEIIGKVVNIGNFKLDIQVEIWVESMHGYDRLMAVDAVFTFAAINEQGKLIPLTEKQFIAALNWVGAFVLIESGDWKRISNSLFRSKEIIKVIEL